MKKVLLSILFSLLCIGSVFSQFDAQFSQYMFNPSSFNPAAVGEGDMIQVVGQGRAQYIGMDSTILSSGASTLNFGINSPIKINNSLHGIGFRVQSDKIGLFDNKMVYFQYAYKKKIGTGIFSIGADIGLISLGFAGSKVTNINLGTYYDFSNDPAVPRTDVSGTSFDMNVGVFYSTPTFYSGISYSHVNSPVVSWSDYSEAKVKGSLYVTGGYLYALPDTKYVIKPSGLFKTDFATSQLDLSSRVEYDNKYWGGLSYRYQDAVVLLAGINMAGGLSVGCSYDIPTSRIITASFGSLELLLTYSFEYVFQKKNSKYKSIRIL